MSLCRLILLAPLGLLGCATDDSYEPLDDYVEVEAVTILDAPSAGAGRYAPEFAEQVERGEYLVELLGCGACHTDGALVGEANPARSLAGSRIGIAWSNPLGEKNPGVVYPSNLTSDVETGIGGWSDGQIANAIRFGAGRHGAGGIRVMPWPGYAQLTDDDVTAMVAYLRSIDPVTHRVPDNVEPGRPASEAFVYFGVYQRR
ncbi:MAG: cytochrome c [Pseudomonadota bacterium]